MYNNPTLREHLDEGESRVKIVLKKDQRTGILTEGIVQDILSPGAHHPRGIKVRLTDGQIGRVQEIILDETEINQPF